jgi:hypothetical protein
MPREALSAQRRFLNALLAIVLEVHRATPILVMMIHYTVLAGWYNDSECAAIKTPSFFAYWVCMIVVAMAWGFFNQMAVRVDGKRNWAWIVTTSILSGMLFVGWSFIRAKPFKCLVDGTSIAYIAGPIVLWLATVVAVVASTVYVVKFLSTKSVYYMVAVDEIGLNEDIEI